MDGRAVDVADGREAKGGRRRARKAIDGVEEKGHPRRFETLISATPEMIETRRKNKKGKGRYLRRVCDAVGYLPDLCRNWISDHLV